MKPRKHFMILAFGLCLALTSCQQDDTGATDSVAPSAEQIDPEYRAILTAWGFDGDDMVAYEDGYIVEGDVFFSREQLEEAKSETRQTYLGDKLLVSRDYFTIQLQCDRLEHNQYEWEAAFAQAAVEWSNVADCGIQFVPSGGSCLITITELNTAIGNQLCHAYPPVGGSTPGYQIGINTELAVTLNTSDRRKMAAVHLLGHTLGLSHTSSGGTPYFPDYDYDPISQVPGTPSSDSSSVMNDNAYNKLFTELSENDKLALQILYPEVDPSNFWMSGLDKVDAGVPVLYEIPSLPPYFKVDWETTATNDVIIPKGANKAEITFQSGGKREVIARVRHVAGGSRVYGEIKRTVDVTVELPDNMTISVPEDVVYLGNATTPICLVYAANETIFAVPEAPEGVTVTWSIENGTGTISGQGTSKASILFDFNYAGMNLVTVKAKVISGTNTKEISCQTIVAREDVNPDRMTIDVVPDDYLKWLECTLSKSWKIGDTVEFTINSNVFRKANRQFIRDWSWECEGVEIISRTEFPASPSAKIKIISGSNHDSYQARITLVVHYKPFANSPVGGLAATTIPIKKTVTFDLKRD